MPKYCIPDSVPVAFWGLIWRNCFFLIVNHIIHVFGDWKTRFAVGKPCFSSVACKADMNLCNSLLSSSHIRALVQASYTSPWSAIVRWTLIVHAHTVVPICHIPSPLSNNAVLHPSAWPPSLHPTPKCRERFGTFRNSNFPWRFFSHNVRHISCARCVSRYVWHSPLPREHSDDRFFFQASCRHAMHHACTLHSACKLPLMDRRDGPYTDIKSVRIFRHISQVSPFIL